MPFIHGPAIVTRGGTSFYFREGLNVRVNTQTGEVPSDFHGIIDTYLRSRSVTIAGRPVGMIANLSSYFGLGIANVGESIFGASDTPLVIKTKAGQTITYPKSGISRMPALTLRATDQLFSGDMEWTCLGGSSSEPTAANHWKTIAAVAFSDTTFDETKIKRYRYTANYTLDPDYEAMTAQEGFALEIAQSNQEIPDDNAGIADIGLSSLSATCRFIPSNLTEAQIDLMVRLQSTGALLPGESLAKGTYDLVITGDDGSTSFEATLHNAGFGECGYLYQTGRLRQGEVMAVTRRTWTAGVSDPLWTFTVG